MAASAAPAAPPCAAPETDAESSPLRHKVRVENFFGPLNLLLHLVREAEIDVVRVPLSSVARQYVEYITAMQKLDMVVAGEFLVVASQLMLIKTRSLVPAELRPEEEQEEEDAGDTSVELIRKLLDYKRYKDRARALDRLFAERSACTGRPRLRPAGEPEPEPLRNMELWDLVLFYSRILKSTRLDVAMRILYRDVPIEVWMDSILKTLLGRTSLRFSELVGPERDRTRVVGNFLAILQLARQQRVKIVQGEDLGDIELAPGPESSLPDPGSEADPGPATSAPPPSVPPA